MLETDHSATKLIVAETYEQLEEGKKDWQGIDLGSSGVSGSLRELRAVIGANAMHLDMRLSFSVNNEDNAAEQATRDWRCKLPLFHSSEQAFGVANRFRQAWDRVLAILLVFKSY